MWITPFPCFERARSFPPRSTTIFFSHARKFSHLSCFAAEVSAEASRLFLLLLQKASELGQVSSKLRKCSVSVPWWGHIWRVKEPFGHISVITNWSLSRKIQWLTHIFFYIWISLSISIAFLHKRKKHDLRQGAECLF